MRQIRPGAWVVTLCRHCGAQQGQVREQEEQIKPVMIKIINMNVLFLPIYLFNLCKRPASLIFILSASDMEGSFSELAQTP